MDKKEKIKQIYQKNGVGTREEDIDCILKDEEKTKQFMDLYEREKIDSMNYIFGKPDNNKEFTQAELEMVNKINLFDRKTIQACKNIYERESKKISA